MHETVIGVASGVILLGVLIAVLTPIARASERAAVRKVYGLPRNAKLVRIDGVLFPAFTDDQR